jgi:hypothetical protein
MTQDEMHKYDELEAYRGYSIMVRTDQRPTTWLVDFRIGRHEGGNFIIRRPSIRREFCQTEGLLNHMLGMANEARESIDNLAP